MNAGADSDVRLRSGGGADPRKRIGRPGGGSDGSLRVVGAGDIGSLLAVIAGGAGADGTRFIKTGGDADGT